jgi:ParB-like chromosome segregation protein Spo0J
MKTVEVNPETLQKNPWNTNYMSPENETKLDASLSRLGIFKPVICRERADGALEILAGEHRAQSAIRVGLKTVPVINLGKIPDSKAKEIGLADNSRYGMDDTLGLAKLLAELGSSEEIASFLPFTDADMNAIFSASNIALDELELPEISDEGPAEPAPERVAKTHTIMRFKVPLGDAERITEKVTKVQKHQSFTSSDELTNAGDALVHIMFGDAE